MCSQTTIPIYRFLKWAQLFLKHKSKTKSYQKEKPSPWKNSRHFAQHKPAIFVFFNRGLKSALAAFIIYGVASEDELPLPSHVGQETDPCPTGLWPKGLGMLLSSPRRDSTNMQGAPQSPRADKFLEQEGDAGQKSTGVPPRRKCKTPSGSQGSITQQQATALQQHLNPSSHSSLWDEVETLWNQCGPCCWHFVAINKF